MTSINTQKFIAHTVVAIAMLATGDVSAQDSSPSKPPLKLSLQDSDCQASLRGAAVGNATTAWASGSNGTLIRTRDAGQTWQRVQIPETSELDFRDIQVLSSGNMLVMSAGPGAKSNVYRTTDDGLTWTTCLTCNEPKGFFNAMSFWDQSSGILVGDPIDGHLDIRRTDDAGKTWRKLKASSCPELNAEEYGFAASGTNIETVGDDHVWIATGGSHARVFRSSDRGESWQVADSPITAGKPSTGIFSIAFRDAKHGVVIGGDYKQPAEDSGNVAFSIDGGETWVLSKSPMPHKACVRWIADQTWVAAGRTGIALSHDDGRSWEQVSTESFYTFDLDRESKSGWLAGTDGRVATFSLDPH